MGKILQLTDMSEVPGDFTGIVELPDKTLQSYRGSVSKNPSKIRKWFFNGTLHREDGPAIEYPDGKEEYFLLNQKVNKRTIQALIEYKVMDSVVFTLFVLLCIFTEIHRFSK